MLEPISLGQGRTQCPGLAADDRGVMMGRRLALFFPDLARTVGYFRSYSREMALDEVLASLEIRDTISERGGRELMVRFEVQGSFQADRSAQAARMHQGRVFTGTDLHFVTYRDRRSPLGYDLPSADMLLTEDSELVLYSDAGVDRRQLGRALSLRDLILGLTPRPLTDAEKHAEQPAALVVCVEQGLVAELCRYLWSRQVSATIRSAVGAQHSVFSAKTRRVHLVRCENLPHHLAASLSQIPGMQIFVPVLPEVLVQWGYRHPISLESCAGVFPEDETVLFRGAPRNVERILAADDATDLRDLIEVEVSLDQGTLAAPAKASCVPIENMGVQLKLARIPTRATPTQALLIDVERLPWFMKMTYLMPAAVLRAYEAVIADPYIIVVNRRGVHGIPFGHPMTELFPHIFVPVGMQLLPRVDYDLLREHLQIRSEQELYFFPEEGPAFTVPKEMLRPLSRAIVAPERARESLLELRSREVVVEIPPSKVGHRRQSVFSLWRGAPAAGAQMKALGSSPTSARQLPSSADDDPLTSTDTPGQKTTTSEDSG